MKLTKTLSAIILILAFSVTALVSCEGGGVPSVTSPLDAADAALASSAYTARVTMLYSSDDPEMADAIGALGASGKKLAKEFFIGRRNISTMSITLTDCSLEQNWVPT